MIENRRGWRILKRGWSIKIKGLPYLTHIFLCHLRYIENIFPLDDIQQLIPTYHLSEKRFSGHSIVVNNNSSLTKVYLVHYFLDNCQMTIFSLF